MPQPPSAMRNLVGVQERRHIHMNATGRQFRQEIVDAVARAGGKGSVERKRKHPQISGAALNHQPSRRMFRYGTYAPTCDPNVK